MVPVMTITPDALPRHFWLYVGHAGDYNRVFDTVSYTHLTLPTILRV